MIVIAHRIAKTKCTITSSSPPNNIQSRFMIVDKQPGADFVRYPVLLETATTYRSLGGFIAALEALPHMVRIDRIAVSASADDKISVKILVTCFLQPGE